MGNSTRGKARLKGCGGLLAFPSLADVGLVKCRLNPKLEHGLNNTADVMAKHFA